AAYGAREIFAADDHHRRRKAEFLENDLRDARTERSRGATTRLKDDIAALDIGANGAKACPLERCGQVLHRHLVPAAEVDSAQQRDPGLSSVRCRGAASCTRPSKRCARRAQALVVRTSRRPTQ